ncbi:MAG TPA: hypothetical protein VLX68_02800 [Chitinivibrionales bacterium]|nr:hypothetical protein [Chitinivibrionales bacterium]
MKLLKVLVAVLACASFVLAQEAAAPAAAAPAKAEKGAKKEATTVVTGTVVSVDAIANTIVVKAKKGEETISVETTTKIKSGKADVQLGDIKADAKVKVTCKMVDGKKVATQIVETPAAAPKAMKKDKAAAAPAAAPAAEPAAAPAAK